MLAVLILIVCLQMYAKVSYQLSVCQFALGLSHLFKRRPTVIRLFRSGGIIIILMMIPHMTLYPIHDYPQAAENSWRDIRKCLVLMPLLRFWASWG